MIIVGIDPGPHEHAFVAIDVDQILPCGAPAIVAHGDGDVDTVGRYLATLGDNHDVVTWIEMVAAYGMPVGAETFETCVRIGQLIDCVEGVYARSPKRITRSEIKRCLVGKRNAKDSEVGIVLRDIYGGKDACKGTKRAPGPLYGISGHQVAALAIAVAVWTEPAAQEYRPPMPTPK